MVGWCPARMGALVVCTCFLQVGVVCSCLVNLLAYVVVPLWPCCCAGAPLSCLSRVSCRVSVCVSCVVILLRNDMLSRHCHAAHLLVLLVFAMLLRRCAIMLFIACIVPCVCVCVMCRHCVMQRRTAMSLPHAACLLVLLLFAAVIALVCSTGRYSILLCVVLFTPHCDIVQIRLHYQLRIGVLLWHGLCCIV